MKSIKRDDDEGIGYIREILTTGRFKVELLSGRDVVCYLASIARSKKVRLGIGDRVRVELEGYHGKKGRITYKYRDIQAEDGPASDNGNGDPEDARATPPENVGQDTQERR